MQETFSVKNQPKIKRALIVEDESSTRSLIEVSLRNIGYICIGVSNVSGAQQLLSKNDFQLMILDLGLEDGDGVELINAATHKNVFTIVTSARADIVDRLVAFELGADDYLVKPVDLRELNSRILRTLRRGNVGVRAVSTSNEIIIDSDLRLDLTNRVVIAENYRSAQLTRTEFTMLRLFLSNKFSIFTREHISKEVLGRRVLGNSRSVDALMSKLRKKIDPHGDKGYIISMRNEGYLFANSS